MTADRSSRRPAACRASQPRRRTQADAITAAVADLDRADGRADCRADGGTEEEQWSGQAIGQTAEQTAGQTAGQLIGVSV